MIYLIIMNYWSILNIYINYIYFLYGEKINININNIYFDEKEKSFDSSDSNDNFCYDTTRSTICFSHVDALKYRLPQ